MSSRQHALILSISVVFLAVPAYGYEKLLGDYQGKITQVEGGYLGRAGDPCTVKITDSGGTISFAIGDQESMQFPAGDVTNALAAGGNPLIKISGSSHKGAEYVALKVRDDGSVGFLKLQRKYRKLAREQSIACGDLKKK